MTPKLYTGLRKANDKKNNQAAATKQNNGRLLGILGRWPRIGPIWDKICCAGVTMLKKWPLNGNFMAIWDKICCMLAALGGYTLNRGSFACKFVRGDMQLAAKGRGTLNRGGRN